MIPEKLEKHQICLQNLKQTFRDVRMRPVRGSNAEETLKVIVNNSMTITGKLLDKRMGGQRTNFRANSKGIEVIIDISEE